MHCKKATMPKGYEAISVQGIPHQLGFGSCGTVHLAKCLKTGQIVAIKKINYKVAVQEVEFHLKLQHPNIIKLLNYQLDEKNQSSFLILEYAENGTLYDYIKENGSGNCGIKDRRIVNGIFHSICDAVQYIHSLKIIHRDIKPQNILLDEKNVVKLCDFGSAAIKNQRTTLGGTVQYMAPEILAGKVYDYRVDIWALGILYYELIEGHSPFRSNTFDETAQKIKKPIHFSNNFTSEQMKFLSWILKQNPEERPEIKQIIASACINGSSITSRQYQAQFDQRLPQIPKNTESPIKLLEVKNLIENPEKKIQNSFQKRGIKIISIRQYHGNLDSPPLSPTHAQHSKWKRANLLLALSRQKKISLKRQGKH